MNIRTVLLAYTLSCCAYGIASEAPSEEEQEQEAKEYQSTRDNYWQIKKELRANWGRFFHFHKITLPDKQTLLRLLPDDKYSTYHKDPEQLVRDLAEHLSKQKTVKPAQMSAYINKGLQAQHKHLHHFSPEGLLLLQFYIEGALITGLLRLPSEGPNEAAE